MKSFPVGDAAELQGQNAKSPEFDRFEVTYMVQAETKEEAWATARTIAYEQTLELPCSAYPDMTLGTVEGVQLMPGETSRYEARISYDDRCTGTEVPQFLNVLYGNSSMKQVEVLDVTLNKSCLSKCLPGPRFGIEGMRALCGVSGGALVCTALKPMGKCVAELAAIAYACAKGGIHIIKDDHGLANQPWAPFCERVTACAEAVQRANSETGLKCLYAPCLNAPMDQFMERARYAKAAGAGAIMALPGISGWDSLRLLRMADDLCLPILCHPALLGASLGGSLVQGSVHGMTHSLLLGKLPRLLGADATIFPNVGGRFGFTPEECNSIVEACVQPTEGLKPALPVPAGGMRLAAIPTMKQVYGDDVIFLIGGDLLLHGPDLTANAVKFMTAVRGTTCEAPPTIPSTSVAEVASSTANGTEEGSPAQKRRRTESSTDISLTDPVDQPPLCPQETPAVISDSPPDKTASVPVTDVEASVVAPVESIPLKRKQPAELPLDGNHGKVLQFNDGPLPEGCSRWKDVPLEDYKPPEDNSWKGITRTELIGRRGESPLFHTRYFEVQPGGYTTLENHQHEHVVIVFRGKGWCIIGQRSWPLKVGDVIYTSPGDVHQFGCDSDAEQDFGFFCIVNAERDRPVRQDHLAVAICE